MSSYMVLSLISQNCFFGWISIVYLSALGALDKLLALGMGHHVVAEPVLADHLLPADLAHVQHALQIP